MKKLVLYGGIGILTIVAMVMAMTLVSYAGTTSQNSNTSSLGGIPKGAQMWLNLHYKVTNDEDSGNVGYWALDNYSKTVKVYAYPGTIGSTQFYVVASYSGSWTTFKGALSPGAGVTEGADASGTFKGGYVAEFTATSMKASCTAGGLGTFDFGGSESDILLGTYSKQTGDTSPYNYLTSCFNNPSNFQYINWGWTYNYKNQQWSNTQSGTTGDIVVK